MVSVILTGGNSSRMGRDKACLEMEGGRMSQVLAKRYLQLGSVYFSVDRPGRFENGGFPELYDAYPGQGPLNGLYSAFSALDDEFVFLTATDMPNGDPALVERMLAEMGGHDICTLLRPNGYIEPLFSIYRRSCFPLVRSLLEKERNSFRELFGNMKVRRISQAEFSEWEFDRLLQNLNTPQDYLKFRNSNY